MSNMQKTTKTLCLSCKYHWKINQSAWTLCDYLSITGKRRNCSIGKCDKYEKRKQEETTCK